MNTLNTYIPRLDYCVIVSYEHSREELSRCVIENTKIESVVNPYGKDLYDELSDQERIRLVTEIQQKEAT